MRLRSLQARTRADVNPAPLPDWFFVGWFSSQKRRDDTAHIRLKSTASVDLMVLWLSISRTVGLVRLLSGRFARRGTRELATPERSALRERCLSMRQTTSTSLCGGQGGLLERRSGLVRIGQLAEAPLLSFCDASQLLRLLFDHR